MATRKRARDYGIKLPGNPGPLNAITDVSGVEVGFSTVIFGEPGAPGEVSTPCARTGVTAILPRGRRRSAVFAGRHDLNGNGELTGTHWIDDSGFLHGPVMITNTNSVGIVRDTTAKWMIENRFFYPLAIDGREIDGYGFFYPVVGETFDGFLNDINGFHVKSTHVLEALESCKSGPVAEGNLGGGTGMICHGFKGGTGTASRVLPAEAGGYTVGVLVQANHGSAEWFQINGVSMAELQGRRVSKAGGSAANAGGVSVSSSGSPPSARGPLAGVGSIIVIIATDAPLLPHQLSKVCRRATIGIGRLGGGCSSSSGDLFLAFSTSNESAFSYGYSSITIMHDDLVNPIFRAAAEATEEAILNALCAAETMKGRDGNVAYALPVEEAASLLGRSGGPWEPDSD